jgi:HD superfamily phosphohydrolase
LYKRSIEEQIACLIHDLSHTAFSHVIDFVMKDVKQEFADNRLEEIINKSDIPKIIEKYGFDLKKVLDKTKFPLLDNSLPDVSMDRWDYFMRDGFMMGFLPKALINSFLSEIYEKENVFYFKDLRLASTFAILYVNFCRLIWLDPNSHGSYFLLGEAIKIALDDKLIIEEDFFTNDEVLLDKLKLSSNIKIKKILDRLTQGKEFVYEEENKAEFFGPNKARFVDPLIESNGKLIRVSDLTPNIKYFFEEFSKKYKNIGVRQLNIL